jgi:glycosyltransferase involved in cell wall biosynthesis
LKVGYLIPEFPGQTHIFFWREMEALRALGVEIETISTRRPAPGVVCHDWSQAAIESTHYLFPPRPGRLARSAASILGGGPATWSRCLAAFNSIDDASAGMRARMAALAVMGRQLADVASERGWDHVHVHSCGDSALIATFANVLADVPYSLTLHGPVQHYGPGQALKWTRAKFGVTVTNRLRNELLATVEGIEEDRVIVASMGVDTELFRRSDAYRGPEAGRRTMVVTCGRLHEHKGHQDLVAAVDLLVRHGVDVGLKVLGEGPARPILEAEIGRRGLEGRVELLGAVAEQVVREELEHADLFALASHDEAIGVATMEAMAMGLPVIVTDVGGVDELVSHEENGLLVPAHKPQEMSDAIRRLIEDAELCASISTRGRETVAARFDCRLSAALLRARMMDSGRAGEMSRAA